MRFGGDHPTDRRRHRLAVALCREAGILDAPGVALEPAPGAAARRGAGARVRARPSSGPSTATATRPMLAAEPEARQWGIGGDNNAYDGMHDDSARACAACARGRRRGGGRARPRRARARRRARTTAWPTGPRASASTTRPPSRSRPSATPASSGSPTSTSTSTTATAPSGSSTTIRAVLTVSVHESGRHLFPGSGFPAETGGAEAPGSAANVALPPFAGDDAYRAAMDRVVAARRARLRAGRDRGPVRGRPPPRRPAEPHAHDDAALPASSGTASSRLADEVCDGRLVALGGGGYEPCTAPPRAWALLAARMAGAGGRRRPGPRGVAPHRPRRRLPRARPRLARGPRARPRPRPRRPRRRRERGRDPAEPHRPRAVLPPGLSPRGLATAPLGPCAFGQGTRVHL